MEKMGINIGSLLFALAAVCCVHAVESPHPYHVSLAEVEFNAKSGNFEVALCVWPTDLEKALSTQEGRTVDLQQDKELDKALQRYVQRRFLIRSSEDKKDRDVQANLEIKAGDVGSVRWVGHQVSLKQVWLFFEVKGDNQQQDWTIENRVFFELNDDQLNHFQWSIGKQHETFICRAEAPRHGFSLKSLASQSEADSDRRP